MNTAWAQEYMINSLSRKDDLERKNSTDAHFRECCNNNSALLNVLSTAEIIFGFLNERFGFKIGLFELL